MAIARALVTDPEMILADEPTGNLDSRSGLEVLAIFKRLHRQGRTIVLVTHDEEVAEHADRVIVLKDGTVAEDRRVAEPRDAEQEKNLGCRRGDHRMRLPRIAGEGIQALGINKLRTFFMMAGTIVGVAALVVIMAIGKGTEKKVMKRMQNFGPRAMMLIAGGGKDLPPPDMTVTT